ncbi:MAG: universal stress protein [Chitinophagaceae bacterium]|nr:MAG: universal stress protein [Chitinophagaceae bacterium]
MRTNVRCSDTNGSAYKAGPFYICTLVEISNMDTILVPVDFSPASRTASSYAAALAKASKARLILFHAYMMPTPVTEVPYVMISVNELQTENEQMIRREAAVLHENFGIEVESQVQIGMPSDEITLAALESKADMIVIGMRGAGGLDKLIGNTSASVVRKAKTPVLVVPHNAIFKPVNQIVYASDFSYSSSLNLFRPLLEIADMFQALLHVVNIRKAATIGNTEKEMQSKSMISGLLGSVKHEFTIITDESITHGINNYVDQHDVQMLVMVAHKHTFFERLFSRIHTTEMAYQTKIPLLVLHDG